jgi:hypothetical protein
LAWGRNRAGQTARAGGWGYVLGDEGSGFDLARQALGAITQAADGRAEPTDLSDAVLRFWNLSSPTDLVAHVYRQPLRPAEIAQLAPLVVDVASPGDPVSRRVVLLNGAAHATAVCAVSARWAWSGNSSRSPVVSARRALVRAHLLDALGARGCECAPVIVVDQPVVSGTPGPATCVTGVDMTWSANPGLTSRSRRW